MKRQKGQKQLKRDALMSFLQTSATPTSQISIQPKRPASDHQQVFQQEYVEGGCGVCGIDLGPTRKQCGFCGAGACGQHLRKRRKKKGKWERICDGCQDKYLYDSYMKLESKADEALAVQQEITILKHDNFAKESNEKRQQRREIGFKTMALQQAREQVRTRLIEEQKKIENEEGVLEGVENGVKSLEAWVGRATAGMRENHQESWKILSQENARMARELAKLQKKAMQIKASIQKKQKEIEQAFESWSQRQFKKKLQNEQKAAANKKEGCDIY